MRAVLPLGLSGGTGGRGSGHIANFVKTDCTQAWVDGGDHVEVVDLTFPSAPRSLGKFESAASHSDFKRTTPSSTAPARSGPWAAAARPATA